MIEPKKYRAYQTCKKFLHVQLEEVRQTMKECYLQSTFDQVGYNLYPTLKAFRRQKTVNIKDRKEHIA